MNVVELHVVILNDLCPLPLSHGKNLGPVARTVDNAVIHRINLYPVDNAIDFPNTYPPDSDISGEWRYPTFEQPEP